MARRLIFPVPNRRARGACRRRSAGDVPRSAELTRGWRCCRAGYAGLAGAAPARGLAGADLGCLHSRGAAAFTGFCRCGASCAVGGAAGLAASFVAALVAPMLLSGWVFARSHTDDLRRASLSSYFRLLSQDALFDALACC